MTDPPAPRAFRLPSFGWWIGVCLVAGAVMVWIWLVRPIVAVNRFLREARAAGCYVYVESGRPRWFRAIDWPCGIDDPEEFFIPGWDTIGGFSNGAGPIPESWFDGLALAGTVHQLTLEGIEVDDALFGRLLTMSWLHRLHLQDCNVTDAGLRRIASHVELTNLYLDGTPISDEGLASLSRLTSLRSAGFERTRVTGHGLRHLSGLPELEYLFLSGHSLTDTAFEEIGRLPALKYLSLKESVLTAKRARALQRCAKLEFLTLWDVALDPDALADISRSKTLASLEAHWRESSATDLSQADLTPLLELKTLQLLSLAGTRLTDDQIRPLAAHPSLSNLSLDGTDIHGTAFEEPGWRTLTTLDLAHTACDDRAVAILAGLPALESLDLTDTRITDACVADLVRFPKLADVRVSSSALSPMVRTVLKTKRPGLSVENDFGTMATPPGDPPPAAGDSLPAQEAPLSSR